MKPVYTNHIHLIRNGKNNEFTLTFSHVYTEHSFTPGDKGLMDVSAPMCEEVGSFIMNREALLALQGLLNKTVRDMEDSL